MACRENSMKSKIVSVVLGSYNRFEFLQLTIESIRREVAGLAHEIIVVDGGSTDGALAWLLAQKDIITILQHNRGEWDGKQLERRSWGYFMNLAFKCAQGKYICMVSDDALFVPGSLRRGIELCEQEQSKGHKIGAAAFYFRDWPRDAAYHVSCTLGNKLYVNHGLYLNPALEEVGYIDEETCQFYNADGDVCLSLWQAGYEVIVAPDSYVEHYPHANEAVRSTNEVLHKQDLQRYLKKWTNVFYDPVVHNLGMQISKEFTDVEKTALLFDAQHRAVLAKNPHLIKPATRLATLHKQVQWKYEAGVRKVKRLLGLI